MWPFRISQPRESKASRAHSIVALGQLGKPQWSPRNYNALAQKGYAQNPVVYRCVRMIAESAASVPLYIMETNDSGDEHPLLRLLRAPNPRQAGPCFMEALIGHLLISGDAYVEAVKVDDTVAELYALRPDRMRVVPGPEGWPQAYDYVVGGNTVRFRQDEEGVPPILHLSLFHPLNDHYGLAPLEAAASSLDILNAASSWHKALLDNSARPSGALVYAPASGATLSREQYERLKEELEQNFQGAANAGRPLLLEGGLDWRAMSLSPRDMDFLEARNAAARDVALAFGVPPILLGIPGDATYANYQEANRAFWRHCVLPLLSRLTQSFSHWLAPAFGNAELRFDADAIPALDSDREALWRRVNEASFLTDDEKREAVGYVLRKERKRDDFFNKYDPGQPRVPAGNSEGGQWTDGGYSSSQIIRDALKNPELQEQLPGARHMFPDDHIDPADDILFLAGGAATSLAKLGVRAAYGVAQNIMGENISAIVSDTASQATIQKAAESVERFLGGKIDKVINKNGNYVFLRGRKKVKFDITPSRGQPHYQLEILTKGKYGKPEWNDAMPGKGNHQFFFKGK